MTRVNHKTNVLSGNSNYYHAPKALVATSVAIFSSFAIAGSGGIDFSVKDLSSQDATSLSIMVDSIVNHPTRNSSDINTNGLIVNQLNLIQNTFGLHDEEFAKACNVTRGTIVNWKHNTSSPRDKSRERVFNLYIIAKDWKKQSLPNERDLIIMPVVGNESVLSLLQTQDLDKQKILFAGRRLLRQSQISTETDLL